MDFDPSNEQSYRDALDLVEAAPEVAPVTELARRVRASVARVIVGKSDEIELMLVAMLLAPASTDLFTTSWPHFALTGVLSFIVVHSLARSYDLAGAVHASLFDFVIKPAVLTCAATTFSYAVEAWLRHSTIDSGAALSVGQLSPEHYVIVFATLAMAGERLLGYGLLNRWQAAGHLSTSVVVFGAASLRSSASQST